MSNRKRLVPLTLVAMLTLSAVAALAPAASAQTGQADTTTEISITPYDTPIKPLSGIISIPISIVYTYTAGVAIVPTAISLTVSEAPPWAVISISPSTVYVNPLNTGAAQDSTGVGKQARPATPPKMLVSTTADAPAFSPANVKITATAKANGDLKESSGADSTLITADFFSILDASAAQTIQLARPQKQVVYPITVQNFGNANTKTFYEITSKPDGWQVQEPIPLTLEAKQQGGKQTTATVNLNILTPYHNGYLNEVGAITMKITSNYALDTKQKGDTTQVSVLTTVKGFYVPGPSGLFVVLAIAGAALVLGRVRRR
ncbi:MAG TPA: hypothetical protein VI997_02020 [Candidatus Thermoplasmatota archaeon]|nr:hypothetical protein [Candidatus Thermoplasmatota archaeon]